MMRLFISPAKKMRADVDFLQAEQLPQLLSKACELLEYCRGLTVQELKKLLCCNDGIAALNYERYRDMVLEHAVTPALLAFDGIQYQYMAPQLFTEEQFGYVRKRLYILSGFYGVLCPSDAVIPYRLEMQAKLETENATDLYHFWNNQLYQALYCKFEKDSPKELINLASAEYSKAVLPYLTEDVHCVTCVFGEFVQGKVKVKATLAKMARGEMVRWMAEHQIQTAEDLKQFTGLGFAFEESLSSGTEYVFLKKDICPED